MSAAEVSLALRVAGTTRADVAAALWEERSLVKTFGPRGTVHVLPAADLAWWLAALGSVPKPGGHPDGVRLLPDETDAVVAALDAALREEDRTTEELDAYVAEACGPWAAEESMAAFGGFWPRWRLALGPAAVRGVLCFGPNRGRKIAYASPSRWLPDLALPDPAEAQLDLLRAYLAAYGPATPAHLARWLATSPAWARELFERADLDEVELEGEPAWVWARRHDVRRARGAGGAAAAVLRRLPGRLAAARRCCSRAGRRSGRWRAPRPATTRCCCSTGWSAASGTRSGPAGGSSITVEPLGRLTKAQRAGARRRGRAGRRDRRGPARPHRRRR